MLSALTSSNSRQAPTSKIPASSYIAGKPRQSLPETVTRPFPKAYQPLQMACRLLKCLFYASLLSYVLAVQQTLLAEPRATGLLRRFALNSSYSAQEILEISQVNNSLFKLELKLLSWCRNMTSMSGKPPLPISTSIFPCQPLYQRLCNQFPTRRVLYPMSLISLPKKLRFLPGILHFSQTLHIIQHITHCSK